MPIAAGSFRSRSTTGVDAVTGFGFTPAAIVLTVESADFSDTALTPEIFAAYCISDGTTTRSVALRDADAVGTSETARAWTDTIRLISTAAITFAEATLTLESDGFELDWTTIPAAQTVCYWAIGGVNIDATVLLFNRSGTGIFSVTGAGFQPKALVGIGYGFATPPSVAASSNFVMLGMADDDADLIGIGAVMQDAQATANSSRVISSTRFFIHRNAGNSVTDLAIELDSLDADGFTMNATTVPGDRYYAMLCLGGADMTATHLTTLSANSTTGANTQTMTGLPFEPAGGLLYTISGTSTADALSTGAIGVGGFDDSLNQWATYYNSRDNVSTTESDEGASTTSAFLAYNTTDALYDAVGEITAKDADSIDVAWDASKTATTFLWSALLFDLDEATVVSGTMAGSFGALTGTMSATVIVPEYGVLTSAFGGLTGTIAGTVVTLIEGTAAAGFGQLTGTMAGAVVAPTPGVMAAAFGSLTGTLVGISFIEGVHFADLETSAWRADLVQPVTRYGTATAANLGPLVGTLTGIVNP